MNKYDKLKDLKEMFDNGLLEEAEFNNFKNQILFDDNIDDSEIPQNHNYNYQNKNEKPKRTSTLVTIVYIIIGIILFAFVKKTFLKNNNAEIIPITTEANGNPKVIHSNDYTNEYTNGLHENENENNTNNSNYQNNNSYQNNGGYHMGSDGRVYENSACSLCKGSGVESGQNFATGEIIARICPMCDGRGVRNY